LGVVKKGNRRAQRHCQWSGAPPESPYDEKKCPGWGCNPPAKKRKKKQENPRTRKDRRQSEEVRHLKKVSWGTQSPHPSPGINAIATIAKRN